MKKIFLAFFLCAAAFVSSAQNTLVVDPLASVRTVSGDFTAINVSGGIDLYLSQANEIAIAVSASEEKFKENIKTEIENGTLRIYYDDGSKKWSMKNRKLKVYVSFKTLEQLKASGACDVLVTGSIETASLDMNLSGACDFKGMVKVNSLRLNLSGASDVTISGTAGTVNIESSGASDVKGYELVSDVCHAKASGASDINITVNKEMNAHASGASDIHFKGDALIKEMHSGGASSISRKKS